MKKIIKVFLLVVSVATLINCSSDNKTDLKYNRLNGKVKYIERCYYKVTDKSGKITKGMINDYYLVKYNKEGNIELYFEKSQAGFYKHIYKYDSLGNRIQRDNYNENGDLNSKIKAKFDANSVLLEVSKFNIYGGIEYTYTYKYDKEGNPTEVIKSDKNGGLINKWIYKYDSNKRKIEEIQYNNKGLLENKFTYKYDLKDNITEKESYKQNGLYIKYIYKFDKNGNEIEINSYNKKSELLSKWTMEYVFDKHDNWIKQTTYNNSGKAEFINERKIVYYGDKDENNYSKWDNKEYNGSDIEVFVPTQTETIEDIIIVD